jgi:hypothetical protein
MTVKQNNHNIAELTEKAALISAYLSGSEFCSNSPRIALGLQKKGYRIEEIFTALRCYLANQDEQSSLLFDISEAYCRCYQQAIDNEGRWRDESQNNSNSIDSLYLEKKIRTSELLRNHLRLQQEGVAFIDSIETGNSARLNKIKSYWHTDMFIHGFTTSQELSKVIQEISDIERITTEEWFVENKRHDSNQTLDETQPSKVESDFAKKYNESRRASIESANLAKSFSSNKSVFFSIFLISALSVAGGYFLYSGQSTKSDESAESKLKDLNVSTNQKSYLTESLIPQTAKLEAPQAADVDAKLNTSSVGTSPMQTGSSHQVSLAGTTSSIPGTSYGYYGELSASGNVARCRQDNRDDEICIQSDSEWKNLCERAVGVSVYSRKIQANSPFRSESEKILIQGGVGDVRIVWGKSNANYEACFVLYELTGIVNGNSVREVVQGIARNFTVSDKGRLLVGSWGTF